MSGSTISRMLQSMKIWGGTPISGEIAISGSKNLALPALAASLLTDSKLCLNNVPKLSDVTSMLDLLSHLGVEIDGAGSNSISLKAQNLLSTDAPYDFVRKMRASILVLGPLIARCRRASVSLPGGCAIGARGVDLHIKALELLGAEISLENGYINAAAPGGLVGCDIVFPTSTVTGTENAMMAAVLAQGKTRLINAAIEPEIVALAEILNKMGAKIENHGTSIIEITGVDALRGAEADIIPDRIEAGTYAIAAAATGGRVLLRGCVPEHLTTFFDALRQAGAACEELEEGVLVIGGDVVSPVDIQTAPYPGFPTDLQAQFMTLMSICSGTASITENIFENRFMHVHELARMGANISIRGNTAVVTGVPGLAGANVMATDLRASVSLVLAGLMASGETVIGRLYHLNRGYEDLDLKLRACGAHLERFLN